MQSRRFMPSGMIVLGISLSSLCHTACRDGGKTATMRAASESSLAQSSDAQRTNSSTSQSTDLDPIRALNRPSCDTMSAYRIVGGQSAATKTQVTAATLRLSIKAQRYCSATLIGPHHIVTAAHCLVGVNSPAELRIGYGLDGLFADNLRVDAMAIHPQFNGILADDNGYLEQPFYDVAVIHFQGQLPPELKPVSIAAPSEIRSGMSTLVAGYGAYSSDDKTRRPLSQVETKLDRISPELSELQLKAGDGRGACFGDSGGPTFIVDPVSSCLLLIGSTTGPGRNTDYTCESGGGTLMDLTRHQSWLSCAFTNLKDPLEGLTLPANASLACDSK